MRIPPLLILILILSGVLLSLDVGYVYGDNEGDGYGGELEQCATCHYVRGSHQSLGCYSCHNLLGENLTLYLEGHPSNLINSSPLPIFRVDISKIEDPYEFNEFCGSCHTDILEDYEFFAHGNVTYVTDNHEVVVIKGYKDVFYRLHIADDYYNLQVVPGKACIECHNPHDPVMEPLSILPKQSYRPEPPNQSNIITIGISAVVVGLLLLVIAGWRRWF